ncbi:MAG: hypothetical protein ACRD8O_12350 [Bryobacteraceae bacterium]
MQERAMQAWEAGSDFRAVIESDPRVRAALSPEKIEQAFSLERQIRNVDKVIDRVFRDS